MQDLITLLLIAILAATVMYAITSRRQYTQIIANHERKYNKMVIAMSTLKNNNDYQVKVIAELRERYDNDIHG